MKGTIKDIVGDRTLVDGNAPIEIVIEPCDVKGSKPHNQTQCAIARAVKRTFLVPECYVLRTTVWIDDGERLIRFALPPSLQKEIVSFDRNKDFRPGRYQLSRSKNPDRKKNAERQARYYKRKKALKAKTGARAVKDIKLGRKGHETEGLRSSDI